MTCDFARKQLGAEPSSVPERPIRDLLIIPELPFGVIARVAGWLSGILMMGALIGVALHFGDVAVFISTIRSADPFWRAAAGACQIATYACAAAVWSRVLSCGHAGQSLRGLFKLAVVQLFANHSLANRGPWGWMVAAGDRVHHRSRGLGRSRFRVIRQQGRIVRRAVHGWAPAATLAAWLSSA